jgi:hypothetical protein
MKNNIDLYNSNKGFYEKWPCRKKMILDIFPKMYGTILNVGVHDFNKSDGICFPDKNLYHTIDLVDDNKKHGSKYNHMTGDILDLSSENKYNNIILFGVLNIPNMPYHHNINPAEYSLYDNDNIIIEKVNDLLEINGQVLFGPDIPKSTIENSKITEKYYDNLFFENKIINENFNQTMKFIGKGNIIYIYTKVK